MFAVDRVRACSVCVYRLSGEFLGVLLATRVSEKQAVYVKLLTDTSRVFYCLLLSDLVLYSLFFFASVLQEKPSCAPFLEPVNIEATKDYLKIVSEPMGEYCLPPGKWLASDPYNEPPLAETVLWCFSISFCFLFAGENHD